MKMKAQNDINTILQKTIAKPVYLITNAKKPQDHYEGLYNGINRYSQLSFKSEKIINLALALYMQKFGTLGGNESSKKIYNEVINANSDIDDNMINALSALIEHCDTETCASDKITYFFYTLHRENLI